MCDSVFWDKMIPLSHPHVYYLMGRTMCPIGVAYISHPAQSLCNVTKQHCSGVSNTLKVSPSHWRPPPACAKFEIRWLTEMVKAPYPI